MTASYATSDTLPPRGSRPSFPSFHVEEEPIRVMLAEQDDATRNDIAAVLRRDGYEVLEARDGAGLLELISASFMQCNGTKSTDILIADARLPDRSGLDALLVLRRQDALTPVILLTGHDDETAHADAFRLGADAVLLKPIDVDVLRIAVKMLVAARDEY